jgi:hypothetical protein
MITPGSNDNIAFASRQQQQQQQQQQQGQQIPVALAPPASVSSDIALLNARTSFIASSLNDLSDQMNMYQQQMVQRQDRMAADVSQAGQDQSSKLSFIIFGIVLILILVILIAIYTTIMPYIASKKAQKKESEAKQKEETKNGAPLASQAVANDKKSKADESASEGIDADVVARQMAERRRSSLQ